MLLILHNILEGRADVGPCIDSGSSCLMFFTNLVHYLGSFSPLLPFFFFFLIKTWSRSKTHLVAIKMIKTLTGIQK